MAVAVVDTTAVSPAVPGSPFNPTRLLPRNLLKHYRRLLNALGEQPAAVPNRDRCFLAQRLQRHLVTRMPLPGSLEVALLSQPADPISGDVYDLRPVGPDRWHLWLADATGHGAPAAASAWRATARLHRPDKDPLPPDLALRRLNMMTLGNPDAPDPLAAVVAEIDYRRRTLSWARGGLPYPVLLSEDQPPRQINSTGGLIGAWPSQQYELVRRRLQPRQALLFYTDGFSSLLLAAEGRPQTQTLIATDWVRQARPSQLLPLLTAVRRTAADPPADWHTDDVTAVAVSM